MQMSMYQNITAELRSVRRKNSLICAENLNTEHIYTGDMHYKIAVQREHYMRQSGYAQAYYTS